MLRLVSLTPLFHLQTSEICFEGQFMEAVMCGLGNPDSQHSQTFFQVQGSSFVVVAKHSPNVTRMNGILEAYVRLPPHSRHF